jgi:hypothetical protein
MFRERHCPSHAAVWRLKRSETASSRVGLLWDAQKNTDDLSMMRHSAPSTTNWTTMGAAVATGSMNWGKGGKEHDRLRVAGWSDEALRVSRPWTPCRVTLGILYAPFGMEKVVGAHPGEVGNPTPPDDRKR